MLNGIWDNLTRIYTKQRGLAVPILHHHIPKTAGTTFNALLDSHYPNEQIMPKGWIQHKKGELGVGTSAETVFQLGFERFRLIHVHANMLKVKPDHWLAVTFLRNPVHRVISQITDWSHLEDSQLMNLPADNIAIKLRARTDGPKEMLDPENSVSRRHLMNGMCKSLLSGWYRPKDLERMSCETMACKAQEVLEDHVDFLGTLESFLDDLKSFAKLTGLKVARLKSENRSSSWKISAQAEEDIQLIREYNEADVLLWTRVTKSTLNY